MKGERPRITSPRTEGWIIVEALIALVLLAVALGPLASSLEAARTRAVAVQARTEAMAEQAAGEARGEAWTWGPALASAEWLPGPALKLGLPGEQVDDSIVGIWIGGWFLGEMAPDSDGSVALGAHIFASSAGCELVVRVRSSTGGWGPPWRFVVPDALGDIACRRHMAEVIAAPDVRPDGAFSVLHAAARAEPTLRVSAVAGALVRTDGTGLPVFLRVPGVADYCAEVGSSDQSWKAEEGRALDTYF